MITLVETKVSDLKNGDVFIALRGFKDHERPVMESVIDDGRDKPKPPGVMDWRLLQTNHRNYHIKLDEGDGDATVQLVTW